MRLKTLLFCLLFAISSLAQQKTFTNPVLPSGPDPWIMFHDGFYYYMNTTGANLTIWKTRSVADLRTAEKRIVWTPPATGPYSHDIWAPELHWFNHRWYIYFAADSGKNISHRLWVLENPNADPLNGQWTLKGELSDSGDHWAIDASAFENKGRLYLIWSGWEGSANGAQNIYIAELANPWTIKGDRVKLSSPEYPWEKAGDLTGGKRDLNQNPGANREDPIHVDVNEGPEILQHNGRIFLVYSASGCWTDYYELGMLSASADSDLLNPASWTKSQIPVFWESPSAGAFGTGHNSFFQSPDGKQDWILYHANSKSGQGCGGYRSPRAQPFQWKPDGTPDFGRPVPLGTPLNVPSGEASR